jgi:hypothetical protein
VAGGLQCANLEPRPSRVACSKVLVNIVTQPLDNEQGALGLAIISVSMSELCSILATGTVLNKASLLSQLIGNGHFRPRIWFSK